MSRSNLPCWTVRVLAAALGLLAASPALGLVQHPNISGYMNSEWDPSINLGPAAAIVGRWSNNASATAIGPNDAPVGYCTDYVITTRHQGAGMGINVNFGGADYYVYDVFIHPTADLRIVRIRDAGGQPAALADWAGFYTAADETTRTNRTAVVGGFGKSRGDTYPNYYTWAGSDNLTQRWGQNKLVDSVNNMSAGSLFGESYKSNVLRASFDNYGSGMRVPYESAFAEFDSGGGWFLPVGDQWKLVGLSAYVQMGGGKSYFSGVNPPPNTGEMLSAIRISSYANWIDAVFKRSTWQSSTGGSWADPANWDAGVPSGKDKFAVFLDSLPGSRTVTVGAPAPFGTLRFDSPGNYTIDSAGAGKLECLVTIGAGAIEVYSTKGAGSHTITAPIKLTSPLVVNQDSTSALLTLAGPLTTPSGLKTGLTKVGAGTLVLAGSNTFNNGLEVRKGTVRVTSAGALGNPAPDADIKGVALLAAGLDFRTDTDLAFVHDVRVSPLTASSVTSTLNVDRLASGTGRTVTLGTLTLEGAVTLNVTGGNGYTLAVSGLAQATGLNGTSATINTAGADLELLDGLTLNQGTLAKTGPGTLTLQGTQTHGAGSTLAVNEGVVNLNTNAGALATYGGDGLPGVALVDDNSDTIVDNASEYGWAGSDDTARSANLLLRITSGTGGGNSKVVLGSNQVLAGLDVQNATGGLQELNLNDKAVRVFPANVAVLEQAIRTMISAGIISGDGIYDSTAAADERVGYTDQRWDLDGAQYVGIRAVYGGDANMDGKVNLSDLAIMGPNYGQPGVFTWDQADFNYDGVVNLSDLAIMGPNYGKTGGNHVS